MPQLHGMSQVSHPSPGKVWVRRVEQGPARHGDDSRDVSQAGGCISTMEPRAPSSGATWGMHATVRDPMSFAWPFIWPLVGGGDDWHAMARQVRMGGGWGTDVGVDSAHGSVGKRGIPPNCSGSPKGRHGYWVLPCGRCVGMCKCTWL